ncbi:MAG: family 1 encapsulin nanocompartment shell protein [Bacteroidales bacterium]
MDILRKSMAPISKEAWEEINDTAKDVLSSALSARKIVDVQGPMGLKYAALPVGRIRIPENQQGNLKYGIHQVLPMVEARIPFKLNIWELDNLARGAEDIDLDALEEAAREIAQFEENVIYEGLADGSIAGLKNSSDYESIPFPEGDEEILQAVTRAISRFKMDSIGGPYSLVLSKEKWQRVNSIVKGYPLNKQLEKVLGGSIIMAPFVKDSYLVSQRGGDCKMVIGQDLAIGYESHDHQSVQLYLTESFTFQIIEPRAFIVLT